MHVSIESKSAQIVSWNTRNHWCRITCILVRFDWRRETWKGGNTKNSITNRKSSSLKLVKSETHLASKEEGPIHSIVTDWTPWMNFYLEDWIDLRDTRIFILCSSWCRKWKGGSRTIVMAVITGITMGECSSESMETVLWLFIVEDHQTCHLSLSWLS